MEPSPPLTSGISTPLRIPLRWDTTAPHPMGRRHHHAKVSPRHVKLQSVNAPSAMPTYAVSTLHDQIHGHFRHHLFQLHQLLQDAVAHTVSEPLSSHTRPKPEELQLTSEIQRNHAVFTVLTSDHHVAVLDEFFRQWRLVQHTPSTEDHELLSQLVDVIFRNVPAVLTEDDVRNPKSLMRFVDTLKTLRELILSLLYKTHEAKPTSSSAEDDEDSEPVSGRFASTSALLAALGSVKPGPSICQSHEPSVPMRIPLYLYCQQLEHENEVLQRRLRSLRQTSRNVHDDVGLLHEQTMSLLVQFWELPRLERLAFFCQVASQAKQDDCDSVLRVFLAKCDTSNLLSLWDALQMTASVQHALAVRRHREDADAAAREAAEAMATASRAVEERHQKHGNGGSDDDGSGGSSGDDASLELRGRRGKRFAVALRGIHRPSQRVDLRGLADGFEPDEEDEEDEDRGNGGTDNWGSGGGKRRRRKLRIHDRGRTPEGHRSHRTDSPKPSESKHRSHLRDQETETKLDASKPLTPKPILDRLHSNLLELLKDDDPTLDHGISDAAWKLVELIDRSKRHDSIVPRGSPRKLSTFQQHTPLPTAPALATTGAHPPRALHHDPLGSHLPVEQQYFIKIDQLQSLLASLGAFSLPGMSADAISSAYKRMTALQRLFQAFQQQVYGAVGLDVATTSPAAAMTGTAFTPAQPTVPPADTVTPPAWADDHVMESVEVMLHKLGKMVRSLAPIADVGGPATSVGSQSTASSEILQLADTMEEIANAGSHKDTSNGSGPRRHLSLDPARRMGMLNRLKSLAQGHQIETLTGLLSTKFDDLVALQAVSDHQQRQLQEFASSFETEFLTEDVGTVLATSATSTNDEGDEVLKLVKKAKNRRASAAKLAASSREDVSETMDDDESLLMNPMTAPRYANRVDIPLNIKQATAQRGSKLFNAGILLRVVDQMYRENYETMVASLQYGSRRMEFSEFMYDWHIRKYGLKSLAQQHLLKLIQSLRKHERKVFQCHLCLRFLGIVQPLGFHEHKFVLGLLDKWSNGTFSGASKNRIEFVPRQFKVRIAFAIPTIQEALSERFGVYFRTMDTIISRIKSQAMPQDDEFIKESDLLTIALDEWQAQRERIEQILEAVYTAGDLNGDGSLEYDEFSAVMLHLSPSLTDKFVQRVFTAAHDYLKPRRISFARFLDVVLLERVLNTSASGKTKNSVDRSIGLLSSSSAPTSLSTTASGPSRGATEDEEIYQFNLLQETWENDRDVVAQALSTIPHPQTVASIQFRVAFLTQILSKRVDSKTAWMCHRQIMRDIRRYQNLNDEQIVAVKTKEETFKKAVMAIRHLQRLSLAFRRPTQGPTTDVPTTPEVAMPSSPVPEVVPDKPSPSRPEIDVFQKQTSYVSVVEGVLAAADNGVSSVVDMEALENQIRERFLERADEEAIEDFKNALQTIRRRSNQSVSPPELVHDNKTRRDRTSITLGDVVEVEEEEEEEEEDEEDEDEDEDIDDDPPPVAAE